MPPIPPHLHREHSPHERERKHSILKALCISTLFVGVFAGALSLMQLPITVVLPTAAPIWAGLSTILK